MELLQSTGFFACISLVVATFMLVWVERPKTALFCRIAGVLALLPYGVRIHLMR